MLEDHTQFVNDVSIIFINNTDPTDPLKREQHWRNTGALRLGCLISSSYATVYLTTFCHVALSGVTITGTSEMDFFSECT